jgi:hypothetical protein
LPTFLFEALNNRIITCPALVAQGKWLFTYINEAFVRWAGLAIVVLPPTRSVVDIVAMVNVRSAVAILRIHSVRNLPMNPLIIIVGIVAVAIVEILIEWLFRVFGIPPNRPTKLQIILGIVILIVSVLLAAWPSLQPTSTDSFTYLVRVQEENTSRGLPSAKVTIEAANQAPLDEITDTNGFARIFIDSIYAGKAGRLLIEANGYELFRQEIDLRKDLLPDTVKLKPIPQVTPSPSPSPTTQPATQANISQTTQTLLGRCGGKPISLQIPSSPADFNRLFGFTVYNTSNSHTSGGGLLGNIVRSLFVDEGGVWVGYGNPPGGISFVSNPIEGKRSWENCADAGSQPIGRLSNSITKDKVGNLWVATDGDGVWELQNGVWEQFAYDELSNNSDLPSRATYTVVSHENSLLVGALTGIIRYNNVTWTKTPLADRNQVHALAFSHNGDTWIGFVNRGIRRIRADGSYQDYNAGNSGLSDDDVRSIAIDNLERVWIGTWGGGISVFDGNNWLVYRAEPGGLPSNNVNVVIKDKHGRIWVGTDHGTNYFDFSSKNWNTYNDMDTYTIGFGKSTRERCGFNDENVWIGTNGAGLTHSRLPAASPVFSVVKIDGIPKQLAPNEIFKPLVTIMLEKGYNLTAGDFLQVADQASYTASPLLAVPSDATIEGGEPYTFDFASNQFTAPQEPGQYKSAWRLWQCGRYVGPPITFEFTVRKS